MYVVHFYFLSHACQVDLIEFRKMSDLMQPYTNEFYLPARTAIHSNST